MAKHTYHELLKDPRWQKKRLEIMQRDDFSCRKCGDGGRTLQVHHLKYCSTPWESLDEDLQTLCECCHRVVSAEIKLVRSVLNSDSYDLITSLAMISSLDNESLDPSMTADITQLIKNGMTRDISDALWNINLKDVEWLKDL